MTQNATIYHNPRCSKSRQTLELLRERGVEASVVEYLKTPLNTAQLTRVIQQLGCGAHAVVRAKEALYQELGLSPTSSEPAIIQAIVEHPSLLERPIVVVGEKAAIGRPPENVLSIL